MQAFVARWFRKDREGLRYYIHIGIYGSNLPVIFDFTSNRPGRSSLCIGVVVTVIMFHSVLRAPVQRLTTKDI